ncbi:protein ABHD14A isoform X2 [Gopherus evgoodei]|uniref:Protein ABHD14A n=1 Tax=Gopherus evgoodei TaxID=1825980 RepID=A0A8C4W5V3_9SAUR|nr:protein ABHD14A isoform X2 [Gopherus evgoodei]
MLQGIWPQRAGGPVADAAGVGAPGAPWLTLQGVAPEGGVRSGWFWPLSEPGCWADGPGAQSPQVLTQLQCPGLRDPGKAAGPSPSPAARGGRYLPRAEERLPKSLRCAALPGVEERLTMALIRTRLGLLVLGVLVTFVLYLLLPAIQHERFTSRAGSHKAQARAEEKGQRDVNVTVLTGTIAGSPSILFREGFLLQRDGTPSPKRLEVIFLHGQAFTSKTWEDLGTLTLLSEEGYRSIAIDLPGYGNSLPSDAVSTEQGRVAFLQHVLKELGIQRPVLISPSMSGRYSIPFVLVHGAQLKGFVPIAPVGTQDYTSQQYQQVQTPTLIVYGERDTGLGAQSLQSLQQLPKHKAVALPDAGHACYLEKPHEFHEALLAFLGELQ